MHIHYNIALDILTLIETSGNNNINYHHKANRFDGWANSITLNSEHNGVYCIKPQNMKDKVEFKPAR